MLQVHPDLLSFSFQQVRIYFGSLVEFELSFFLEGFDFSLFWEDLKIDIHSIFKPCAYSSIFNELSKDKIRNKICLFMFNIRKLIWLLMLVYSMQRIEYFKKFWLMLFIYCAWSLIINDLLTFNNFVDFLFPIFILFNFILNLFFFIIGSTHFHTYS